MTSVYRGFRLRLFAILLVLQPAFWCREVRAGDTAIAEELFREGKQLMRTHDYTRACPKLAESFRQDPATGTLLALAVCDEEAGLLASAWATYKDVVARAHQEGRSDRESAARGRAAALEPRLSTLRVDVGSAVARLPGLVVSRDGVVLAPAAWGSPLPTDPGTHVVEARADGRAPHRETVAVGGNADRKAVAIISLDTEQLAAPERGAGPMSSTIATPDLGAPHASTTSMSGTAPASKPGGAYRIAGVAGAGLGVVGLGLGTAFALYAKHLDNQSKSYFGMGNESMGQKLNQQALQYGDRATVLSIAGGALLAGGAALYWFGHHSAQSVDIAPVASVGFGGAALLGRF